MANITDQRRCVLNKRDRYLRKQRRRPLYPNWRESSLGDGTFFIAEVAGRLLRDEETR